MRYFLVFIVLGMALILNAASEVSAYEDPTQSLNNPVGIHIFNEENLEDAANLVNSAGGDWGYVTVVITEKERDVGRWQKAFDKMRRLHLIPIIRVATRQTTEGWSKPDESEIPRWINFFNSLNWVIKNRYIVIGNEPNHKGEWGGDINPSEYAKYLKSFSSSLRQSSNDYFVLPAALDASAKNTTDTMDESLFLRKMISEDPSIFNAIDGWNSHSYPNPDFSGKETDNGRGSIKTYDWELTYLGSLGSKADWPVFITETGWSNEKLSENEIGKRLNYAFNYAWNDKRIIAITPFILDYPLEPFKNLSWRREDGKFRTYYEDIKNMEKSKGKPIQEEKGNIIAAIAQPIASADSDYAGIILAKNNGQSIWRFEDVSIVSESGKPFIKSYSFNDLEPGRVGLIVFRATSSKSPGLNSSNLFLKGSKGQQITNSFPIETLVLNLKEMKIGQFFGKILSGFSSTGP